MYRSETEIANQIRITIGLSVTIPVPIIKVVPPARAHAFWIFFFMAERC